MTFLTLLQPQAAAGSVTVTPGVASLVLTGYAPTVTAGSAPVSVTVTPGCGALVITGYPPTVSPAPEVEVRSRSYGGFDPHYYKKRKKKQPEAVSKDFGDDWKPPMVRPAPPATLPLPAQEILARQGAGFARTQTAIIAALEQMERQRAEAEAIALAEQEDEDEAILLLMAA